MVSVLSSPPPPSLPRAVDPQVVSTPHSPVYWLIPTPTPPHRSMPQALYVSSTTAIAQSNLCYSCTGLSQYWRTLRLGADNIQHWLYAHGSIPTAAHKYTCVPVYYIGSGAWGPLKGSFTALIYIRALIYNIIIVKDIIYHVRNKMLFLFLQCS